MNILYLCAGFTRPHEPGLARVWLQTTFLARRGHRVTVIASQRHPLTDTVPAAARGKMIYRTREAGLEVWSVATPAGRRLSMRGRLLFYVCLAFMTLWAGLRVPKVDLVFVGMSTPLLSLAGWLLARIKGARLVTALSDLHPEEAVDLGLIKSPWLIRLWEAMENFHRKRADLLVAIVPRIKPLLVAKGFSPGLIHISTNAYDPCEERQEPLPQEAARALDRLKNRFLVMYAGTISWSVALELVLEAAQGLQESHPEIHFVIVGLGDKLPQLKKQASNRRLTNLTFLEPVPRNCMSSLLSRAQAVTQPLLAGKIHGVYELPNKLFEYLGSGKPIIYAGRGDIAKIIKEASCGLVTRPEDPKAFAEAVAYLWENQEEAREMGQRGRQYVMKHFDRRKILTELVQKLESLPPRR
jgi:glycosyltransferase involved in cell wall biosynthesis